MWNANNSVAMWRVPRFLAVRESKFVTGPPMPGCTSSKFSSDDSIIAAGSREVIDISPASPETLRREGISDSTKNK